MCVCEEEKGLSMLALMSITGNGHPKHSERNNPIPKRQKYFHLMIGINNNMCNNPKLLYFIIAVIIPIVLCLHCVFLSLFGILLELVNDWPSEDWSPPVRDRVTDSREINWKL